MNPVNKSEFDAHFVSDRRDPGHLPVKKFRIGFHGQRAGEVEFHITSDFVNNYIHLADMTTGQRLETYEYWSGKPTSRNALALWLRTYRRALVK